MGRCCGVVEVWEDLEREARGRVAQGMGHNPLLAMIPLSCRGPVLLS